MVFSALLAETLVESAVLPSSSAELSYKTPDQHLRCAHSTRELLLKLTWSIFSVTTVWRLFILFSG
jgi:hypothetical protein